VDTSGATDHQLAIAVLAAARAEWEPIAARPPELSDDDWTGPAAELFRLGEAQLRSAAITAHDALGRSVQIATLRRG
jgi:hypothetical protein